MIRGHIPPNHGKGTGKDAIRGRATRQRMFEEQEGKCHWCSDPMEMNALYTTIEGNTANNPRYASFEHVIPKMAGGGQGKRNVVLAHAKCNNKRHKMKWPHDPYYSNRENRVKIYKREAARQKAQLEKENDLDTSRNDIGLASGEPA